VRCLGKMVAVLALSVLVLATPRAVAAKSEPRFCAPKRPARDFGFSRLPPVNEVPVDGQLPFARPNVEIYGGGMFGHVLQERGSVGYGFSEGNYGGTVRLDWTVTMQMWLLGRGGKPLREVDSETLQIGELDAAEQPHISVETPGRRGFYRADIQFADKTGARLGAYSSYVKVARSFWKARLLLDHRVYRPGQRVFHRAENLGTRTMAFGEDFAVQHWEGGRWAAAPELTPNGWLLWLGASGPGSPGFCGSTQLTLETAAGWYRIVKPVTELVPHGRDRGRRLVAPFRVAG
jgi:hypothetical protein